MTNEAITFEEKNDVAFLKYLSSAVERGQENGEELAARVEEDPVYGVENSASHLKNPTWTCGYHNAVVNTRRAAVSAVVQRLATHSCRSRLDR